MLCSASSYDEGALRLSEYDNFPAPLYATDRNGRIIYFNPACVAFSGRVPVAGRDEWCVSWQLEQEDGTPLAHDQCPMAVSVREARPVRGAVAVARRPDGDSRRFRPFPTPTIGPDGELVGAINLLVPTDGEECRGLTVTANKCRDLARWVGDDQARTALTDMAGEYDQHAAILRLD